jgi:hypothetical protein
MAGRSFPAVAEVEAEGRSSARRFPVKRRAKLGLDSCRMMRGSYWSSRIERRRCGGKSSTAAEAYRRKENGGEVAPVEVRPRGVAGEHQWGTGKLSKGLGGQWEARGGGSAATSSSPAMRKEAAVGSEFWAIGERASKWKRRRGS